MKLILSLLLLASFINSDNKVIYLSIDETTNRIYKNQIFKFQASLLIFADDIYITETNFSNEKGVKILKSDSEWMYQGDNKFTKTIYLQATSNNIKLPDITCEFRQDDKTTSHSAKGNTIKAHSINWLEHTSHIISDLLQVKNIHTRVFDEKNIIVFVDIEGQNTNMENFYIENSIILQQGIESISNKYPISNATVYMVIPKYIDDLQIDYFNTVDNNMKSMYINISLNKKNENVNTNIKPKISTYKKYELVFLLTLIFIFLGIAFYRKKLLYLFMAFLVMAFFIKEFVIGDSITIRENTKIRIFPLEKSNVFYISKKRNEVIVLHKDGDFYKIILNEKVGWVHKDDIIK